MLLAVQDLQRRDNKQIDPAPNRAATALPPSITPRPPTTAPLERHAVKTVSSEDTSSAEQIQSLLLQQKDEATRAFEQERQTQADLTAEVSRLTGALKEATLQMSRSVQEQNLHLDSLSHVAAENQAELEKQSGKTKEQANEMGTSVWATVGAVVWLVTLFVLTYVVIRLFPKPV